MSPQQELDLVNLSIQNILSSGQSFNLSTGGSTRGTTFASLDRLYVRKEQLEIILGISKPTRVGIGW